MKMKNILQIGSFLFIALLFGCVEDMKFPELQTGASVRIQVDPQFSTLDVSDIPNAKLRFSVFTVNDDIESVVLYGVYYNFLNDSTFGQVEVMRWTQNDFDQEGAIRNVEFTSQFLAEKFGLGLEDLGGGDRFDFTNVTTLADGRVYPDTILQGTEQDTRNIETSIIVGATSSFTVGFSAYVSCPFVADNSAGTYSVSVDEWEDWEPGDQLEVVSNASGTGVIVKGIYSKLRSDSRGPYDVEVLVDAATGIATVAKQPAWEYFWYAGSEGFGQGSVQGSGFVLSCSGVITLTLQHTVAAGSFGIYVLTLQKI